VFLAVLKAGPGRPLSAVKTGGRKSFNRNHLRVMVGLDRLKMQSIPVFLKSRLANNI